MELMDTAALSEAPPPMGIFRIDCVLPACLPASLPVGNFFLAFSSLASKITSS